MYAQPKNKTLVIAEKAKGKCSERELLCKSGNSRLHPLPFFWRMHYDACLVFIFRSAYLDRLCRWCAMGKGKRYSRVEPLFFAIKNPRPLQPGILRILPIDAAADFFMHFTNAMGRIQCQQNRNAYADNQIFDIKGDKRGNT